jgi:Arc/MetJ family transcription regulator
MRTTLNIDEKLLGDVVRATGERSKSKAVSRALKEYVRGLAYDELRLTAGTMQIDDLSEPQREADLRRQRLLDKLREGE